MIRDFKRMRWLPLTAGALLCALGAAALARPQPVANALSLCVGAAFLCVGVCEVAAGVIARRTPPSYISLFFRVNGGVSILVGLVFLLNRKVSLLFMAAVLGLWAAGIGILRAVDAARRRAAGAPWRACAAVAAARLVLGACMLASPSLSLTVWMVRAGLFFLFTGASVLCSALFVDRLPLE